MAEKGKTRLSIIMKKVFLFIKKYWLIIIGVLGALVFLIIRLTAGETASEEKFIEKVNEQKKENEEAIKKADEQVKANNDIIKDTDKTVDDAKKNTDEINKNKEERDKKADDIFG